MTDSKSLLGLAERVEALTGPCRETDALIYLALHLPNWREGEPWKTTNGWFKKNCAEDAIGYFFHDGIGGRSVTVKPYTASLDAAMTLVPEGWTWAYLDGSAIVRLPETMTHAFSEGSTPALALTAAALRALAAKEPGQ